MSKSQVEAMHARKRLKVTVHAEEHTEFIGDDPDVAMEGNTHDADRAEYEAPQAITRKNPVSRIA